MKSIRASSLIALFALALFSMMRVPNAFAWVCQGRVCGTVYGYCCCADRIGCDPQCGGASGDKAGAGGAKRKQKSGSLAFGKAGCECQMVIGAVDPAADPQAKAAVEITVPYAVLLPPAVFPKPRRVVTADAIAHPDTRGPPAFGLRLSASHSLRAPPVS